MFVIGITTHSLKLIQKIHYLFGSKSFEKCKQFQLVDQYMLDCANVVAYV
jgi:hypothetical protein